MENKIREIKGASGEMKSAARTPVRYGTHTTQYTVHTVHTIVKMKNGKSNAKTPSSVR